MAFIRSSKYRHVFGTASRKDACYENFRVTNCAFEGTFIAANKKFIAFCVEVGGGGAFCVVNTDKTGRQDVNLPKVSAHKEYILDLQWNPFNDNMLATCSEDGSIKIWEIPDIGVLVNMDDSKALLSLDYHERRCIQIEWHPIASNVLLSVSQEPKVCVWNLDEGVAEVEIECHPDIIWNAAWSGKGDKIVTSCKDKKLRIFDARSGDLLVEGPGHEGSKAQRVLFTFDDKFLFTTGFSRMSERQYACWDASDLKQNMLEELDTANGCLIPYYDPDIQIMYIAAKGDSVIRYYELVDTEPYCHYINTCQSSAPQRGLARVPKRSVNVNACEVMKFYKLYGTKTGYIEPVSFAVPRKSELYQDDIYPDCVSIESAIEASEWFEGKNVEPNRIDMRTLFVGKTKAKASGGGLKKGGLKGLKAKKEAKETAKSTASSAPKPKEEKKEEPKKETKEPSPTPQRTSAPPQKVIATAPAAPGVNPTVVKELQSEIKSLKDNEKKMKADLKALSDKVKDYDKLAGDIKLLCDAVKKNDERIAALENLVQEESEEEGE